MDKESKYYGSDTVVVPEDHDGDGGGGCMTPTREDCRIPAEPLCPPPMRRKRPLSCGKRMPESPQNSFFRPPDLDIKWAWAWAWA
uniref:Uncharacterized protein n=1 Tax=Tarenaya spinosa TaxID=228870 RepID=B2BXN5_9ROSI|nr:unknown [Tarenaya spinosa]